MMLWSTRIALVAAILLSAACQKPNANGNVRVDPAFTTLVPADTRVMVGTRLEKIKDTPTYQKHFAQMPLPQLDKFAADTGLDPRKDVWEVLFCSNGTKTDGILMVRGRFSPSDMEPKLEREGATRFPYKGRSLFGNEKTAVFFMTQTTALAGATDRLKAVIDNLDHPGGGVPAALQPLLNAVPKEAQFWAVFDGVIVDMPFREDSNLGNVNTMIRSLKNGWVSADLRTGLILHAAGNCTDEASAKQIHDALRGIVGLGRLSTPDSKPELLRAFDGIKVDQQASAVNVTVEVAQDLVDNVLDTFLRPGVGKLGSTFSGQGSRLRDSLTRPPR